MTPRWRAGNQVELLENGDQFFPRVFQAIEESQHEVIVETFILREDKVGHELAQVLIRAAERGARVELTVDAWGSMALSQAFIDALTRAGVCVHLFEEKRPRWLLRMSWFRRLHRKLVVIDGTLAFIGGINFSEDHLIDFGPDAKQDYSVLVNGPAVRDIHESALEAIESVHRHDNESPAIRRLPANRRWKSNGSMRVMFISRDNRRGRRTAIEKHYRSAIHGAQRRLIIANAYFFPGYLLLREIRNAARRGVDVRLVIQAEPDIPIAKFGAKLLYDYLLEAGVRIYEYSERQFHGKVALIDDNWTTVGSSNLDPLSLWFNLEANVVIRDEAFTRTLSDRLEALMQRSSREVDRQQAVKRRVFWRPVAGFVVFHFLRKFPRLAGLLPAHRPRLTRVTAPGAVTLKNGAA
jgi:cardiolipin synthase